jgi:UDP-GlcNAc:undecaprenyl-phosphate GlcNAc-1-phosphate transferase
MIRTYLFAFIASLGFSFVLTRLVRNRAQARGWVSPPNSSQHIHQGAIPRLGGVAIYITCIAVVVLSLGFAHWRGVQFDFSRPALLCILLSATLVFALGLLDDLRSLTPYVKFAVQIVAALLLYAGGLRIGVLPILFGHHALGLISIPLTVLWVIGITNAFNLIDGLDGLAAGSALFSTLTVFVVGLVHGNVLVALLSIVLAGATAGFLRFNFNPATIFLGDCGSLFIGFMLSALALAGAEKSSTVVAVAIPVVSFGLPILDTGISVVRRFLSGKALFVADREHIHHRLLRRGFSQRQVVIILYAVSAVFGLLSLFLLYPGGATVGMVLFVLGVGIWIGVQHLGYKEFVELGRVAQRTMEQKQIIVNNLAVRRAIEDLEQANTLPAVAQALLLAFSHNDFRAFDLVIFSPDSASPQDLTPMTSDSNGNIRFSWRKSHSEFDLGWNLHIELDSAGHLALGSFSVYRNYDRRPLAMDINLLTMGFPASLAEAIQRSLAYPSAMDTRALDSLAFRAAGAE